MLSGRSLFRLAIDKELGGAGLTQAQRMAEVLTARRCRNVFFSATAPPITGVAQTNLLVTAQTLAYGMPIIITDILNYNGYDINGNYWEIPNFLMQLFTTNQAARDDFFGAAGLIPSVQTLTHIRNDFVPGGASSHPVGDIDSPSNKIHFAPYLLKPGQVFSANWSVPSTDATRDINIGLDFRGVVVLDAGDQYGQLCGRIKDQVCGYIARKNVEPFIMDLTVDPALFTDQGQTISFATEPQERPLLIYGIATNLNGVSCNMRDQATRWEFCMSNAQPTQAIEDGLPVAYGGPTLNGVPLYVMASNPELTNRDAYYYFPVPHLLEPNTSMIFRLTNGLRPNALTQTFQQLINTVGLYNNGGGVGKIQLLCRTV